MLLTKNNDSFRSLSQIFTPSSFRGMLKNSESEKVKRKIQKYTSNTNSKKFKAIIKFIYQQLEENYRNEYIYKNALLNQNLLNKYCLNSTVVLNEFKVATSIADFVLLNGEIRIFEIKTDLDSLTKLKKQIADYQKFANKVYIVVSSKNSQKLFEKYFSSNIGVIEFNNDGILKTLKEAENFTEKFDHTTIFKTLKQREYLEIINDYFGQVPLVPNTLLFRECLNLVKTIDINKFQVLALSKLKQRNIKCPELLKSNNTPIELKHICYTLDLSVKDYKRLYNLLETII